MGILRWVLCLRGRVIVLFRSCCFDLVQLAWARSWSDNLAEAATEQQGKHTLKAIGRGLGFLIFRVWETSTVKGPNGVC